jgi:hypothetical protein
MHCFSKTRKEQIKGIQEVTAVDFTTATNECTLLLARDISEDDIKG